jgi:nitrous oxide reductase
MLRFLGIATLVLMAVCLAVGASIALADAGTAPAAAPEQRKVEAVDPDRRKIDNSLAAIAPNEISNRDI